MTGVAHVGSWVLADARLRLLCVGTSLYSGQSARAQLDAASRATMIPMFHALISGCEHVDDRIGRDPDNRSWRFHARAIRGSSGAVHAVLGSRVPADLPADTAPPPPVVGSWEWDVPPLVTRWDNALFEVYGYEHRMPSAGWWEAPEFFDILEVAERVPMRAVLERFHHAAPDELIIHTFEARHAQTNDVQRLRLAGRTVWERGEPRWFRGVTMRIDGYDDVEPEEPSVATILTATFALSSHPMCLVDVTDERIYLRTDQWRAAGLREPDQGRLTAVVHPDDLSTLRDLMRCAPDPWQGPAHSRVRFAHHTGWRATDVDAVRVIVRHAEHGRPHVLLKFRFGES